VPIRFIFFFVAITASAVDPEHVIKQLRPEVQPKAAMERMRRLYSTDRWFTFPKFQETTNYIAQQMKAAGLERIEVSGARADGKTQAGFWTMPLAWDVRSATLEIIEPLVSAEHRVLADYQKVPASLGMWSGPTPREGITAELVEIKRADVGKIDLKGKIVMASKPVDYKSALAKAGVVGAVNTFTENESLRDGHQWVNVGGDKGWAFNAGDAPLLSFSISPNKRDYVRALLAKGPVKVRAVVDSRYYEGVYPWVTGVIPGKHPSEEVMLLGHDAEQGAHDNATGVSAMIEAVASINRLIKAGKLERPRRTIRLFVMPEMYGSMDYVKKHPERMKNTVAALCLDTPAGAYEIAGTEYSFYMNPHVSASWVDSLILRVAELYFPLVNRPWHEKPFTPGTDTFLADPMIGVPTTWAYSGSGVETHHNSEDTPDRVDERSLRDISIVAGAFMYTAAALDERDAKWLTELVMKRGSSRAIDSVKRVAARYNVALPVEQTPPDTGKLVVTRKRFGTLPLDDLPVDQREGFPSGVWSARLVTALYWCDGKRSIDEVVRLTRQELGPDRFDWVGYFRFLAKHGYVNITERM
jgi:hypothetical protein